MPLPRSPPGRVMTQQMSFSLNVPATGIPPPSPQRRRRLSENITVFVEGSDEWLRHQLPTIFPGVETERIGIERADPSAPNVTVTIESENCQVLVDATSTLTTLEESGGFQEALNTSIPIAVTSSARVVAEMVYMYSPPPPVPYSPPPPPDPPQYPMLISAMESATRCTHDGSIQLAVLAASMITGVILSAALILAVRKAVALNWISRRAKINDSSVAADNGDATKAKEHVESKGIWWFRRSSRVHPLPAIDLTKLQTQKERLKLDVEELIAQIGVLDKEIYELEAWIKSKHDKLSDELNARLTRADGALSSVQAEQSEQAEQDDQLADWEATPGPIPDESSADASMAIACSSEPNLDTDEVRALQQRVLELETALNLRSSNEMLVFHTPSWDDEDVSPVPLRVREEVPAEGAGAVERAGASSGLSTGAAAGRAGDASLQDAMLFAARREEEEEEMQRLRGALEDRNASLQAAHEAKEAAEARAQAAEAAKIASDAAKAKAEKATRVAEQISKIADEHRKALERKIAADAEEAREAAALAASDEERLQMERDRQHAELEIVALREQINQMQAEQERELEHRRAALDARYKAREAELEEQLEKQLHAEVKKEVQERLRELQAQFPTPPESPETPTLEESSPTQRETSRDRTPPRAPEVFSGIYFAGCSAHSTRTPSRIPSPIPPDTHVKADAEKNGNVEESVADDMSRAQALGDHDGTDMDFPADAMTKPVASEIPSGSACNQGAVARARSAVRPSSSNTQPPPITRDPPGEAAMSSFGVLDFFAPENLAPLIPAPIAEPPAATDIPAGRTMILPPPCGRDGIASAAPPCSLPGPSTQPSSSSLAGVPSLTGPSSLPPPQVAPKRAAVSLQPPQAPHTPGSSTASSRRGSQQGLAPVRSGKAPMQQSKAPSPRAAKLFSKSSKNRLESQSPEYRAAPSVANPRADLLDSQLLNPSPVPPNAAPPTPPAGTHVDVYCLPSERLPDPSRQQRARSAAVARSLPFATRPGSAAASSANRSGQRFDSGLSTFRVRRK